MKRGAPINSDEPVIEFGTSGIVLHWGKTTPGIPFKTLQDVFDHLAIAHPAYVQSEYMRRLRESRWEIRALFERVRDAWLVLTGEKVAYVEGTEWD